MSLTLLADIGGSKSRFALANSAGRPERILIMDNDTVADLDGAVSRYLDETGARPRAATLAIAGPIDGEEVALTNRAWRFRRAELAQRFGWSQLRIVNDFEAIAWALRNLAPNETRPLGKPLPPRDGVKVVLGPGTGLGVAALLPADGRWHVVASEGGHASFGPQAMDEVEVFSRLWKDCGHVSAEAVLSGPGLVRLARALDPQADLARGRNHRRRRARTRAVGAGGDASVRAAARALRGRARAHLQGAGRRLHRRRRGRRARPAARRAAVPRRVRGAPALPGLARDDPHAADDLRRTRPDRMRGAGD